MKRLGCGQGELSQHSFVRGEQDHKALKSQAWVRPIDVPGSSWMLKRMIVTCPKRI